MTAFEYNSRTTAGAVIIEYGTASACARIVAVLQRCTHNFTSFWWRVICARKRLLAQTMATVITANFWMVGWESAPIAATV